MEIATGLTSLLLAFVSMYWGGVQFVMNRDDVRVCLGDWAVGRTWYELKLVGVLGMAGGAALILPMIASVPDTLPPIGAGILSLITVVALIGHIKRLQILRALAGLILADLAMGLALLGLI